MRHCPELHKIERRIQCDQSSLSRFEKSEETIVEEIGNMMVKWPGGRILRIATNVEFTECV